VLLLLLLDCWLVCLLALFQAVVSSAETKLSTRGSKADEFSATACLTVLLLLLLLLA
jgi:hypothetical protein